MSLRFSVQGRIIHSMAILACEAGEFCVSSLFYCLLFFSFLRQISIPVISVCDSCAVNSGFWQGTWYSNLDLFRLCSGRGHIGACLDGP